MCGGPTRSISVECREAGAHPQCRRQLHDHNILQRADQDEQIVELGSHCRIGKGDFTRAYAEANQTGARQIRTWIRDLGIACDLEEKDAFAYTCQAALLPDIEAEAEIARELGFDADVVAPAPLPFDTAGALRFRDEAQFNPAQYLVGLAAAIKKAGGLIFENTRVLDVKPGPVVGEAYRFLLDVRLDEGPIGPDAAAERLRAWWAARGES